MTSPLIEAIARAIDESIGDHHTSSLMARDVLTAITEAGYGVVPVEPTEEMLERGLWEAESCTNDWTSAAACLPGHVYSSMISAAQGDG